MKKTMITAVATAASLLPIAGLAQSSVTLYGLVDLSVQSLHLNPTSTRPAASLTALASDTSRFGFRGTEDLGGGLQAYYKLEAGFQADTGAQSSPTAFFNRETYAGLGGAGWGALQIGSQWAPALSMSIKVDPFTRFGLGGQPTLLQGLRGYQNRYDNVLQYLSPTMGGLSGRLLLAFAEGAATGNNRSAALEYAKDQVYLGAVYDQVKVLATAVGRTGAPLASKTLSIGATYDFKVVKVGGWYQTNRIDTLDRVNGYMLGVSAPVGAGEIKASYARRNTTGADAALWAVGYAHHLSKRTQLYATLGRLSNSGTAAFRMAPATSEQAAAGLPAAGQDSRGTQFGIRHFF